MARSRSHQTPRGTVRTATLPYGLREEDFSSAVERVESLLTAINASCSGLGMGQIEELLTTKATLTAMISDVFAGALAAASERLVVNQYPNGHPDLVPDGLYPGNAVQEGGEGVEVKATKGRVSDAHGARKAWWCQVLYIPQNPADKDSPPTQIDEVQLAKLDERHFRSNPRMTETGTRTSTPNRRGLDLLRKNVVFRRLRSGVPEAHTGQGEVLPLRRA